MINTLLEHVPIKMEVKETHEATDNLANNELAKDDDGIDETDDELDDDDDEDEDDTDTESDALEIEQEATMLISSDEEAELEAQRIRFPDIVIANKLRKDSNISSRSSSRSSQTSNSSSKPQITYEIITKKVIIEETDMREGKSPCFKTSENNKTPEICNKGSSNNVQRMLKSKTESKQLGNNISENNNKQDETSKRPDNNNKIDSLKNSQHNRSIENLLKSPGDAHEQRSRRGSSNSTCSVASTVASDSAETESCGNIYVFNLRQKLIFNCEFCDLKYGDLVNFGRHLHEAHKLFNLDEGPEKENAPRNLPKTNRIPNSVTKNSTNVKKEPLQCFEMLAEPPVALPPSVLAEPLDSCGNVFMLNHRKLFLVCGYCECKYANLDLFEKHLRQQHRIFEGCRNELNVVPKVEVKEEVFIITEVADNKNLAGSQAMVSIPAEIPLNITPRTETKTIATSEETMESRLEINTEQANPPPPVLTSNNIDSGVAKEREHPVEVDVISSTKEPQEVEVKNKEISLSREVLNKGPDEAVNKEILLENEVADKELTACKETRRKRHSSPAIPIESPNKRPKRNTRNNTAAKNEPTTTKKEDKIPEKNTEVIKTIETEQVPEISKRKKPKGRRKSTKPAESINANVPETIEKTKQINKPLKPSEPRKSTKEAQTKMEKLQENGKTTKTVESKKRTPQEITAASDLRKTTKSPQIKKLKQEKLEIEEDTIENKFKCSMCSKELSSKYSLTIHERTHTGEKPYECDVCHKRFGSRSNLCHHKKFHMEDSHKEFKCEICDMNFFHNNDLKVHMATHTFEKRFKCGICLRSCSSKNSLQNHIEKDHKSDELPTHSKKKPTRKSVVPSTKVELDIEPELPSITSSILDSMQEPLVSQPRNPMDDLNTDPVDDIIEQLQNEMVENELGNRAVSAVTYTIKSIVPEIEVRNKSLQTDSVCPDDQLNDRDSTCKNKPTLLKVVKRFFCDVCPSGFDKHTRLVEHKRVHTGERPFACDECGKQFRVRIRLKEHKLRHSKEKKFKCEICQLGCCTKQDLNSHMRHHTNDRRYQCVMCPKAFVRSSDLKIHVRVHTGEKPFVCDICHKCFRANQNLYVHKKSHMGEASKTYQCEHCDKKFMRNIDRKVHMRSHTGEKPYKCEICQRGYSSKVNVRAHIERDHISSSGADKPPKGKKKPGPKPHALREELEKQRKLIQELQNQLWQQIKTDEKIIPSDEEMLQQQTLDDTTTTNASPLSTTNDIDPIQSAYELLNKLKSSTTTSKPLTVIPSPPPMAELSSDPFAKTKKDSTTLLPLTITQKLEQASPSPVASSSSPSNSRLSTPSPPKTTTSTKVVSQKTSLGIQQVSVTVSMQVENVTATPNISEKDSAGTGSTNNVKKERKITSYFTVVGQKAEV